MFVFFFTDMGFLPSLLDWEIFIAKYWGVLHRSAHLEAGIKYPVAVTAGVQAILNDIGDSGCQSYEGRLWDLLTMFRLGVLKSKSNTVYFSVLFEMSNGKSQETKLWEKCGPGDNSEPVITIMLIGED